MRVAILRHATADNAYSGEDRARPLSETGRHEAGRIAARIKSLGGFDSVICSPANRALETARTVQRALGLPDVDVRPDLYDGDGTAYQRLVRDRPGAVIVGHEPSISMLAMELAAREIEIRPAHALIIEGGRITDILSP